MWLQALTNFCFSPWTMVLDFIDRPEARCANNNNTGSHQGYRFPGMPRSGGLRLHNSQYPTGWIQSIQYLRAFGSFSFKIKYVVRNGNGIGTRKFGLHDPE